MKIYTSRKAIGFFVVLAFSFTILASFMWTSKANVQTISVTVTNNTNGDIKHLFFSAPDSNNWSADQLNDSAITPGNSVTIGNASCDQSNLRLIAEDANGCFIYNTVSCSGDVSWSISNDAARDCGGGN